MTRWLPAALLVLAIATSLTVAAWAFTTPPAACPSGDLTGSQPRCLP